MPYLGTKDQLSHARGSWRFHQAADLMLSSAHAAGLALQTSCACQDAEEVVSSAAAIP